MKSFLSLFGFIFFILISLTFWISFSFAFLFAGIASLLLALFLCASTPAIARAFLKSKPIRDKSIVAIEGVEVFENPEDLAYRIPRLSGFRKKEIIYLSKGLVAGRSAKEIQEMVTQEQKEEERQLNSADAVFILAGCFINRLTEEASFEYFNKNTFLKVGLRLILPSHPEGKLRYYAKR